MASTTSLTERKYIVPFIFVTSLFMLWGIAITLGEALNRNFQNVLKIKPSESALVQFSIFGAYAVMAIPAGLFMKRFGYKYGAVFGLLLYAVGAFMFIPSANAGSFLFFRISLFVLACGLATLETVAHPFIASMGHQDTSDQRINFAQSFNGLGTVIGPLLGGLIILEGTAQEQSLESVKILYTVIGSVIFVLAISFAFVKVPALTDHHDAVDDKVAAKSHGSLWQHKHFIWAAIAQFFNVAAQGGTWAFFINYGAQTQGLPDEQASYYFGLSAALMMVGRFLGTFLMRFIPPNKLLAIAAFMNIVMCIIVAQNFGWPSFIALILINFFFSIMFPTIFSLGLKNLGPHTKQASSYIVMGVVGGAIFPFLMGLIADHDIAAAYYLPIICYVVIMLFGWRLYKPR
ncbi:sugar MFS transporter [Pseudochryseolinea flava]|uniref:MFS transporter n=1 Tax=Pseudochryseolinea flava TaxID=2059302 RepID=A0A364XZD4_9BACT|nr:sugar MFS transporter [Pseudochryseolinea flava]RAV99173.1 MFS transporter [Pseudochryseolinea flava]